MESTVRISTGSIFLLIIYKAAIEFILSIIMVAFRSIIMEAFRDQSPATELLSYKEVLYDESRVVCSAFSNCMRLARQFCHLMKEYRERFFTYVLFQPPTRSVAAHLESYLLHVYDTSEFDTLHDDVKQRNVANREMKLAIGNELQTLFHPIVNKRLKRLGKSSRQ